jgi:8-oxo-dGTP pyrophosphatase MutT (NUDIX family)
MMEKTVYQGKVVCVTEETIDGITWERVYLPDGVIIFPITQEGKILLIKEKRPHETPNVRIKPVSGILEYSKGTPEENAQREMQEEIGFKAKSLNLLWHQKASGTVNNNQYFFIATDLVPSKLPNPDGEETIIEVMAFSPQELYHLLQTEQIKWSMSTLGLLRLLRHLGTIS